MKKWTYWLLIAALPFWLTTGCGQSEEAAETVSPQTVEKEVKEAAEAVAALTQQEMDSFVNQMESQLQRFQGRIDDMRSQAEAMQGEAREAAERHIAVLTEKQQQAMHKLDELKSAGADAWDDIKRGLQTAMLRLNQAFQEASREFS